MENIIVKQKTHFLWLDATRFIAAFMVLFAHSRNDFFLPYGELPADDKGIFTFIFYSLGRLGHEAVIVFFVLSGFLVGGVGISRLINGTFNIKGYCIDRFVRIMLPLVSAILLFLIVSVIIGNDINYLTVVGNLFSLQGICVDSLVAPFWSLSYEVWFYIFLGSLALTASKSTYPYKIIGLIIFFIVGIVFVSGLMPHYLLIWLLGAAAYLSRPAKFNKWIFLVSIIGIIFSIIVNQLCSNSNAFSFGLELNNHAIELMLSIMFCLFIQHLILLRPTSKISIWLEQKIGAMAVFSYTLYLCHRIIFLPIYEYLYTDVGLYDVSIINILKYLSVIIITLIASYFIYLLAEKHTASVKKYIKSNLGL